MPDIEKHETPEDLARRDNLKAELDKQLTEDEDENLDNRTLSDFLHDFPDEVSQLRAISNIESTGIEQGKTFTVDFKNNEALEMDITAAIFPPEIREITVSDSEQGKLKGARKGVHGEFFTEDGKRLKIYTGTQVTINTVSESAVLNLRGLVEEKLKGEEGKPDYEIKKYALERGIDPDFFLLLRDEDGSFRTFLSSRERYDDLPPNQQYRMAAVLLGRMQSEFADRYRYRDPQPKVMEGEKYTPEFTSFVLRKSWLPKDGEEKAQQKAIGYLGKGSEEIVSRELNSFQDPATPEDEKSVLSKLNFEAGRFEALAKPVQKMMAALATSFPDVRFISGVRSVAHNERVGGKKDSDHLHGLAFDAQCTQNNRPRLEQMKQFIDDNFGADVFTLVHNPLHLHVSYRPGKKKLKGFPTCENYSPGALADFKRKVDQLI